MAFRFGNGLFEPIWNRDRIDHVQITVAETVGVERRGKFYEVTGALRDMVPNHVFTLLSMVAMEPPTGFSATAIRTKKVEVFAAMPALSQHRRCAASTAPAWCWGNGKGIPAGARCSAGFTYRDLCRAETWDRQLALGWRALLHPYRQVHVATEH